MVQPKVVIIGAGFGGLFTARQLAGEDVEVLLIDRNNYHLFTPLIYQVATAGLDVQDVAYPIRKIFADNENIDFLLAEVTGIQPEQKQVMVRVEDELQQVDYDYLIVAAGTTSNYFGNDDIEKYGYPLKTLQDSLALRTHILKMYERLDWQHENDNLDAIATMVVVGGGPTGIETAGALHELYTHVLRDEYKALRNVPARVILIEARDALLGPYPERLQQRAKEQLEGVGVEVILGEMVSEVYDDHIVLGNGEVIHTHTLVWAAGVKASPLASALGVELARGGRIPVDPNLAVIGLEDVFAVGDLAYLEDENGQPYPQLIPVAQQQAKLVGKNLLRRLKNEPEQTFTYFDRGSMATIGRRRAVAWIFNKVQVSGYPAWFAWLGLHLITLMGFRNRMSVFVNWVWNYFTYDRSARVLMEYPVEERAQTDKKKSELLAS